MARSHAPTNASGCQKCASDPHKPSPTCHSHASPPNKPSPTRRSHASPPIRNDPPAVSLFRDQPRRHRCSRHATSCRPTDRDSHHRARTIPAPPPRPPNSRLPTHRSAMFTLQPQPHPPLPRHAASLALTSAQRRDQLRSPEASAPPPAQSPCQLIVQPCSRFSPSRIRHCHDTRPHWP